MFLYMKYWANSLLIVFLSVYGQVACAQSNALLFFGAQISVPELTAQEYDSLARQKIVPDKIKNYIKNTAKTYDLADWGLVLFLQKFVSEEFRNAMEADQVKILSALLTQEKINHALGKNILGHLSCLFSIEHQAGTYNYEKDGYRFLKEAAQKKNVGLSNIDIVYYEGNNLGFTVPAPHLNEQDSIRKTCSFFNYSTDREDSISFYYSGHYIDYSREFPMSLYHIHYTKSPVSPIFINSLFTALTKKIGTCQKRADSINFIYRFAQTVIKNQSDVDLYGVDDYPCYPESTLVVGKGDCDDKMELFAFLLSYFFREWDFVVLEYDDLQHVRLAIHDDCFDTQNMSYIDYKGKKYLITEVTDDFGTVGDDFHSGERPPTRIHE